MAGTVLRFEEFPEHSLAVMLFKDVNNCGDIRQKVVSGTMQPEAAIINAALVPDLFAVHLSAHKALQASSRASLRTRSLHAELVFGISGSKHIAETLTRFGVNDSCRHLLVARFDASPDQVEQLRQLIQGEERPLSDLPSLTDRDLLHKYYKIGGEELKVGTVEDGIVCRIAGRDC